MPITTSTTNPPVASNDVIFAQEPDFQSLDTTVTGMENPVVHYKFDGDLTDSGGNNLPLDYSGAEERYSVTRGKKFFGVGRNQTLTRDRLDPVLDKTGDITLYFLGEMPRADTVDSVIVVFGLPGTNAVGSNYRWSLYYDAGIQGMQNVHETGSGSGTKHKAIHGVLPSGPGVWGYRRKLVTGSTQAHTVTWNSNIIGTFNTTSISDGTSVTQRLQIGENIAIRVGEFVFYDAAHSDAAMLAATDQIQGL